MDDYVCSELAQYTEVILKLIPLHNHARFLTLLNRLMPKDSSEIRTRVQMEIRRLASPCHHTIDLRHYFDDCELVEHQRLSHFLEPDSKDLFFSEIERSGGVYNLFLYKKILSTSKKRYFANKKDVVKKEVKNPLRGLPSSTCTLVNKNICRDPRLNHGSACRVFYYDPLGMTRKGKEGNGVPSTLLRMDGGLMRIKTALGAIDAEQKNFYLWLHDHEQEINFPRDETGEVVVECSLEQSVDMENQQASYHYFRVLNASVPKMISRYTKLHDARKEANNRLIPNQITPLYDAVMAKGHEQYWQPKATGLPILCQKSEGQWLANSALRNPGNNTVWDFFKDQDDECALSRLIQIPYLINKLEDEDVVDEAIYVLRTDFGSQTSYAVVWQHQLISGSDALAFWQTYMLNGDYRCFQINSRTIDALADGKSPGAAPDHASGAMLILNNSMSESTESRLKNISRLVLLNDITDVALQIFSQQQLALPFPEPTKLRSGKSIPHYMHVPTPFILPGNPLSCKMETVELKTNDLRAEDRFEKTLSLVITKHDKVKCNLEAKTINISVHGMAIELKSKLEYAPGDVIEISLTLPIGKRHHKLSGQPYQIVGVGRNGQLRLVFAGRESQHGICKAFRQFIYKNLDELTASCQNDEKTYGLQHALRTIFANQHQSIPFFVQRSKHQWEISSFAENEHNKINNWQKSEGDAHAPIAELLGQPKFRNLCLTAVNKAAKGTSDNDLYLVLLPRHDTSTGERYFWMREMKTFSLDSGLEDFVKKIRRHGKPTVLKIKLHQPGRVFPRYYQDELSYLSQLSSDKALLAAKELADVAGVGEITDHTEHVWAMYDLMQKSLCDASGEQMFKEKKAG
jgi:hypothetical protein